MRRRRGRLGRREISRGVRLFRGEDRCVDMDWRRVCSAVACDWAIIRFILVILYICCTLDAFEARMAFQKHISAVGKFGACICGDGISIEVGTGTVAFIGHAV